MSYVDASAITLSDMGSMDGGMGGFGGDRPEGFVPPDGSGEKRDFDGNRPSGGNIRQPDGAFPFDVNGTDTARSDLAEWFGIMISVIVLGVGLIVAKKYKN